MHVWNFAPVWANADLLALGLLNTLKVTSAALGLAAQEFLITDAEVRWLNPTLPEYRFTLGEVPVQVVRLDDLPTAAFVLVGLPVDGQGQDRQADNRQ